MAARWYNGLCFCFRHFDNRDIADRPCAGDWVCEHRWPAITSMIQFSRTTTGANITDIQVAGSTAWWSLGDRGFLMVSADSGSQRTYQTGLPPGDYCNVLEGKPTGYGCVGIVYSISDNGETQIDVPDTVPYAVAFQIGVVWSTGLNQESLKYLK